MGVTTTELKGRTHRVYVAQAVIGSVLAGGLFVAYGSHLALSAVFGVLIGTLLTFLLSASVKWAGEVAATDPKRGMVMLYIGAVVRFFVLIAAFAVGLALFGLNAMLVAAGFIAAQFAQLVNARGLSRNNEEEGLK